MAELLDQKHAATTEAITSEETEILEQRAAATATRKEETMEGEDQEFLTRIEIRRNMDRKDNAHVRDISKMIKQGIRDSEKSKNP